MRISSFLKKKPVKLRIVHRINPNGLDHCYVIQKQIWFFGHKWVDASSNCIDPLPIDSFNTLEEAEKNLWVFNGSKSKDEVIKDI